jgi:type 1 fimbria pilin
MKLNKIMVAMGFGLVMATGAANADQGHGTVTIQGSVVSAPCSIGSETVDQTIEMGTIADKQLDDGKKTGNKAFIIKLENCALETGKDSVAITFSGLTSETNPKMFATEGSAKGINIGLLDGSGKAIEPGQATTLTIGADSNTLAFYTFLQGDAAPSGEGSLAAATVTPGNFKSTINFSMVYP